MNYAKSYQALDSLSYNRLTIEEIFPSLNESRAVTVFGACDGSLCPECPIVLSLESGGNTDDEFRNKYILYQI